MKIQETVRINNVNNLIKQYYYSIMNLRKKRFTKCALELIKKSSLSFINFFFFFKVSIADISKMIFVNSKT